MRGSFLNGELEGARGCDYGDFFSGIRGVRVTGGRCSAWTSSSCHHTRNDCGSECFSLEQPKNYRGRDVSVTGYYRVHHSHHNASILKLSKLVCAVGSPPTDRRTEPYLNGTVFESSATLSSGGIWFSVANCHWGETWCHHFQTESKCFSKQWKHATSPPPKKSNAAHTTFGKVKMSFLNTRAHCFLSSWNEGPT
ncbi:hypothetical protein TNCV_139931 [Trichonephila clavipes]|uniref:Uncharacterized protein n=1 Tax=Trichonephila clavipes TaxID=2585209 RepID=A0A8X6RI94_TRICX|nr:hypothetical protein TNCV_139931 [Trichonephila clavipes]